MSTLCLIQWRIGKELCVCDVIINISLISRLIMNPVAIYVVVVRGGLEILSVLAMGAKSFFHRVGWLVVGLVVLKIRCFFFLFGALSKRLCCWSKNTWVFSSSSFRSWVALQSFGQVLLFSWRLRLLPLPPSLHPSLPRSPPLPASVILRTFRSVFVSSLGGLAKD